MQLQIRKDKKVTSHGISHHLRKLRHHNIIIAQDLPVPTSITLNNVSQAFLGHSGDKLICGD